MAGYGHEFLLIASAHFLALLSPGPDFLLVMRSALCQGRRYSLGVCAGIALANGLYIVCALAGFSLLRHNPGLLEIIKWLGCAWLAWMAWQFIRSGLARKALAAAPVMTLAHSAWAGLVSGLCSGGFNPKNALFYLGLFSVGISGQTPLSIQALYGLWMMAVVFAWDWLLASVLRTHSISQVVTFCLPWIELVAGVLLLGLAGSMAVNG